MLHPSPEGRSRWKSRCATRISIRFGSAIKGLFQEITRIAGSNLGRSLLPQGTAILITQEDAFELLAQRVEPVFHRTFGYFQLSGYTSNRRGVPVEIVEQLFLRRTQSVAGPSEGEELEGGSFRLILAQLSDQVVGSALAIEVVEQDVFADSIDPCRLRGPSVEPFIRGKHRAKDFLGKIFHIIDAGYFSGEESPHQRFVRKRNGSSFREIHECSHEECA